MNISRRAFLSTGAAASALNLNASTKITNDPTCGPAIGGKRFKFNDAAIKQRKSFYDLTDEEVRNLCKAIGYMRKNIPLNSTLQWENYAKLHAYHCTDSGVTMDQVHWSWHFLPWHRGYIYFLERILDNILKTNFGWKGAPLAYPYWDWSNNQEIPNTKERIAKNLSSPLFGYDLSQEDMVNADDLGFDNLALYDGNRGPTILKPQMDPNNESSQDSKDHVIETKWFMSNEYVNAMLAAPFELFGGKPITDRSTGQGLLEQGPHNDGHDWVGTRYGNNRNMGTLRYAANDPIFFMHHANIDRIWSLYKQEQPDPDGPWGKKEYTYVDIDGSPITVTVKDIVTKISNEVKYVPPSNEKKKLFSPLYGKNSSVSITFDETNQSLNKNQLHNLINSNSDYFILEIVTSAIKTGDKLRIKIFGNDSYVGRISLLDGRDESKSVPLTSNFPIILRKEKFVNLLNQDGIVKLSFKTNKKTNIEIKGARIITF